MVRYRSYKYCSTKVRGSSPSATVSSPLEGHVGSCLRSVVVLIILVSIVPCKSISKWLGWAREKMDELPLNGPEVQRMGALRGDLISKHNCETHRPLDHYVFWLWGDSETEGVDCRYSATNHVNNHKSQIEYLGHPAEDREAISPTFVCRVCGLFPSVAKIRHYRQIAHHDLQTSCTSSSWSFWRR